MASRKAAFAGSERAQPCRVSRRSRATVLGAGVTGLCVANELADRGVDVTLVDRYAANGPHACSWWAAGMLAPACEGEIAPAAVSRWGGGSIDWWTRKGVDVRRTGTLVVALQRDLRELRHFADRTFGHEWLTGDALRKIEPMVADRFRDALYFPGEGHLNPRAALLHLRNRFLEGGGRFVVGDASEDQPIYDCRGLEARDRLPDLRGVKGEMVLLRAEGIDLRRTVRLLHPRYPLYVVPRNSNRFAIGATVIESSERNRATVRAVLELLSSAFALHPAFAEAEVVEFGSDARPAFPDNVPSLRREGTRIHVNGMFRHGFLLAPALACMAADYHSRGTISELMDENFGERRM